jgi:hypothetical protein
MPRDFFEPTPEHQDAVLIDAATLREATVIQIRTAKFILLNVYSISPASCGTL